MVSSNLIKVFEDAKRLTPSERRQLGQMLDSLTPTESRQDAREQLRRALMAGGLVSHVPTGTKDLARYRAWRPIRIEGKPLSETIIEERR